MPELPHSSNILGAEYDPATRRMSVTFRPRRPGGPPGAVYDYEDVPPEVYNGFMQADSPGVYLRENIVDAFRYQRREQK